MARASRARVADTLGRVSWQVSRLHVRTRVVADAGELLLHTDALRPQAMVRRGDGLVGRGETLRAEFSGPGRVAAAREWFAQLTELAEVSDAAAVPGSGLVAFGSFVFDDRSSTNSVLTIPQVVVGRRDGVSFATEISAAPLTDTDAVALLDAAPLGLDARCELAAPEGERERHRTAVGDAISRIRRGQLSKVVVARRAFGQLTRETDLRHVLRRLAATYTNTWTYAADGQLGASPEMLVRVLRGEVAARVLAGTVARGNGDIADAAARESLRVSAKNRAEHRFAVESALESLRTLDSHDDPAGGLTASPEPFLLQLPNVWHLASDLRGRMPAGSSPLNLVEALHPTAAVGGTPTAAAMDAILELEAFDRGRYAGPTGWLSAAGDGEWVVSLRGASVDASGHVAALAGGGIMAASHADDEWDETESKLAPVRQALQP